MGNETNENNVFIRLGAALLILAAASMLSSCGGGSGAPSDCDIRDLVTCGYVPPTPPQPLPTCDSNQVGIVDGCGEQITALDIHDPVIINLQGLAANTAHSIVITDSDAPASDISTLPGHAAGTSAVTSDKDGAIFLATIVQNMTDAALLGEYTVTVSDSTPAVVQTYSYTVEDRNRVQCTDNLGAPKASFTTAENVFATVTATVADGTYDLYVISDRQTAIPNTGAIPGTPVSITITGGTGSLDLGTYAVGSAFDVLVDINSDGLYNRGSDLISRHARYLPCFVVQAVNTEAPDQIVSDRLGNKREIFDPDADKVAIRDVFSNLTPGETSTVTTPQVADVYVVAHQDVWTDGDPLTDLSGTVPPAENNNPMQNDSNAMANMMQWSFSNLDAGCYDVVVDLNQDGFYDNNTDYYDNVNHLGLTDCGFRVSESDSTNVTITSHADGDSTSATAIVLQGNVANLVGGQALVVAYIRVTSGTQTNIISMAGGAYSVQVPLFSGVNYITVSGVYADDSSRSETIEITSVTDQAMFRAQLTWDGSTDMDLHLVRPGGNYDNQASSFDPDDCNWRNCKVGLDGELAPNSVDWGIVDNEDDDPSLDVDCISCGNGIENIWMSEVNETGTYRVYVDAYSGNEDDSDVIVTISILGSTVGQVNCGNMSAGTATDSCHVGNINWTGFTGSFTEVGTLATDF